MSDLSTYSGLTFFGAVTASVSHELKNRLAIVNEQAGLLEDLVFMSERGGGHPDPNRLAKLAKSLKKQVALGDDLLRHMNRFAHSVDAPTGDTDIAALLECVAALVRRTADRRQVSLDLQVPATPPMAHTSAFLLMQLMWFFLDAAMGQGLPARALSLCCEKAPEGVVISIAGALADDDLDKAISAATDLLGSLGATVTRVPEPPALRLVLPA